MHGINAVPGDSKVLKLPDRADANGHRVFSVLEQVRGIQAGGGFGSIVGRNSFTRPKADTLKLLGEIMDVYNSKEAYTERA